MTLIDELRLALSKATPGPWAANEAPSMQYCATVEYRSETPGLSQTVCQVRVPEILVGASRLAEQNANARLIALAINALPQLLDLAAVRDEVVAALTDCVNMLDWCVTKHYAPDPTLEAAARDRARAVLRRLKEMSDG